MIDASIALLRISIITIFQPVSTLFIFLDIMIDFASIVFVCLSCL